MGSNRIRQRGKYSMGNEWLNKTNVKKAWLMSKGENHQISVALNFPHQVMNGVCLIPF